MTTVRPFNSQNNSNASNSMDGFSNELRFIIHCVILGCGFVGVLVCLVTTLFKNSFGHYGIRFYVFNLMLTDVIHIANILLSFPEFNLSKGIPYNILSVYQEYAKKIEQWTMAVYAFTTIFLLLDALIRPRKSSCGIATLLWLLVIILGDGVPIAIFVVIQELYTYSNIKPPPYSTYHIASFALLHITLIIYILCSCCQTCNCCCKAPSNRPAKTKWLVFLFVIITLLVQYPWMYISFMELLLNTFKLEELVELMRVFRTYINVITYINSWSYYAKPLVDSLFAMILLPSYSCCDYQKDDNFQG
uniref:G_PROTEIN_RECEP_F1_2 domain-containing protein n=1 Tax=Rhabditophanes sp. KR3021 TaxID=114890 RepID=A0AC35UB75_9BILA